MKRLIAAFLMVTLLLSGCTSHYRTDITVDEVVAAYEAAGYAVWSEIYDEPQEFGEIASVRADYADEDYIYFSFFATPEDAASYMKENYHPITMTFFLSIYAGKLYVPKFKNYGCIVVQYENDKYFQPFKDLLVHK